MTTTDLTILGGGLAGLSLALQVKGEIPSIRITVLERRQVPYPEAVHKVGESTVELAAHHFAEVLKLREHLQSAQLRKLGLRLFFTSETPDRIESRVEMGANVHFSVPTYQIDRGIFENFLIERAASLGISFISEARVRELNLSTESNLHTVLYEKEDQLNSLTTKWVVDASGRAALLKRAQNLSEESAHDSNAVWFRIHEKINLDDWCDEPAWKAGHEGIYSRWYSTNHLTGDGYWVWVIPLSSGYTSFGIVTDPKRHPLSRFRSFDDSLEWLREYEPQCAQVLEPLKDKLADFKALKHYAHKCSRVLSGDRWAITGDSGIFLDPLYSPGSDFISIQNTFITDAIKRDFAGERFIGRAEVYNELFIFLTENVLDSFFDQYPLFGNPRVMPLKVIWDYTIYWGFLAFVAIQQRFCDFEMLRDLAEELREIYDLNRTMQQNFREWHELTQSRAQPPQAGFIDLSKIPFLVALNRDMVKSYSEQVFFPTLKEKIAQIQRVGLNMQRFAELHLTTWRTPDELVELLTELDLPISREPASISETYSPHQTQSCSTS